VCLSGATFMRGDYLNESRKVIY